MEKTNIIKFKDFLNEGEINWSKEKSWKIKDQFPIEVFVEKSWTGRYYVIKVPEMTMGYETFTSLDNWSSGAGVSISHYDYETGKSNFTAYTLEDIKLWGEKNKDKITLNYSNLK